LGLTFRFRGLNTFEAYVKEVHLALEYFKIHSYRASVQIGLINLTALNL
jgi:hypothetical protein